MEHHHTESNGVFAPLVPAHPAQGPHARAPLRVPQRRSQGQAHTPAAHPRRAHPANAARSRATRHQVPLLCKAHAAHRSHRPTALLAADAQRHSAQSRTPIHHSMNSGSLQQRRPPSQRSTLARKSTHSTLKTTPDHPTSEARSATQTLKRPAILTFDQRAAAKVVPNAGIHPKANRISTTRFDGVRP